MKGWFSSMCRSFILTALLCFTIGIFGNQEISTNAYIAGYSVTILAVLLLLTNFFSIMIRDIDKSSSYSFITNILYNLFMSAGPIVFMLTIVALVLYNTFKYRTNISNDNVGTAYTWYSESIVLLVILQLVVIFVAVNDDRFENTGTVSTLSGSMLYLFSVLSLMSYTTLNSILNYFTTDGFDVM